MLGTVQEIAVKKKYILCYLNLMTLFREANKIIQNFSTNDLKIHFISMSLHLLCIFYNGVIKFR